jgi:hypothetical protein
MSHQFLYVQFKVTPKGALARATGNERVAIELPFKHVDERSAACVFEPQNKTLAGLLKSGER